MIKLSGPLSSTRLKQSVCQFWQRLRMEDLPLHGRLDAQQLCLCLQRHYHCSEHSAREQVAWFFAYISAATGRNRLGSGAYGSDSVKLLPQPQ